MINLRSLPPFLRLGLAIAVLVLVLAVAASVAAVLFLIVLVLMAAIAVVVGGIYGAERLRRWRADQTGFQEFLAAGARHRHAELLMALAGIVEEVECDGETVTVRPIHIGRIDVTEGRLVAADPSALLVAQRLARVNLPAFEEALPSGRFDVIMLHARRAGGDQRVAALQVVFHEGEVAWLDPAWTPGDRAAAAETRDIPGLAVDSATVAVGGPSAWVALARVSDGSGLAPGPADRDANPYLSELPDDLWRRIETPGGILYIIYTGMGDGTYPAWFARGAGGELLSLILDFDMVGRGAARLAA